MDDQINNPEDLRQIFEGDFSVNVERILEIARGQITKIKKELEEKNVPERRKLQRVQEWFEADRNVIQFFIDKICELFDEMAGPMSMGDGMSQIRRIVVMYGGLSSQDFFRQLIQCLRAKIQNLELCDPGLASHIADYPKEETKERDLKRRIKDHNIAIIEWWKRLCQLIDLSLLPDPTIENWKDLKKCYFSRWIFFAHVRDCLRAILASLLPAIQVQIDRLGSEPNTAKEVGDVQIVLDLFGLP